MSEIQQLILSLETKIKRQMEELNKLEKQVIELKNVITDDKKAIEKILENISGSQV